MREDLGLNQRQFAELFGTHTNYYNQWETLRVSPVRADGEWAAMAIRLAEFHGVTPEWLFPDAVQSVKSNSATRELDTHEIVQLVSPERLMLPPSDRLHEAEAREGIRSLLDVLPPRERQILKWRFGFDNQDELTHEQIGQKLGLSRTRVNQLEARALKTIYDKCGHSEERFIGLLRPLEEHTVSLADEEIA
jgi:RNA polymerase sigma factor (sigma-70 family)